MKRIEYYLTSQVGISYSDSNLVDKITEITKRQGVVPIIEDRKITGFYWNLGKGSSDAAKMNVVECFCVAFAFEKQFYNYSRKGKLPILRYTKKRGITNSEEWIDIETVLLFDYLLNNFSDTLPKRLVDYYCARIQESFGFHPLAYFLYARILEDIDNPTYVKWYNPIRDLIAHPKVHNRLVKDAHKALKPKWNKNDVLDRYNLLDWIYFKKLKPRLESIRLHAWSLLSQKVKDLHLK